MIFWEDIEPRDDLAWFFALPSARRRFRREAARLLKLVYADERAQGIDRFGRRLSPLHPNTIRRRRSAMGTPDPHAPAFIPAHEESRTIAFLRVRITDQGLWCYWINRWGQVLSYHALGLVRGAPARDVMDLSPAGVSRLRRLSRLAWKGQRVTIARQTANLAAVEPGKVTLPVAVPVAKPLPLRVASPIQPRFTRQTVEVTHVESATGGPSGFGRFQFTQKRLAPGGGGSDRRAKAPRAPKAPSPPRHAVIPLRLPSRPAARRAQA